MRFVATLLLLSLSACSVTRVIKAPARPWAERPVCTTERTTMKQDLMLAGAVAGTGLVLVVIGAAIGSEDEGLFGSNEMNGTMLAGAVLLLGGSAIFGGSAGYGLNHTTACRKAQAAYDRGER
jgi:hypothetical protein